MIHIYIYIYIASDFVVFFVISRKKINIIIIKILPRTTMSSYRLHGQKTQNKNSSIPGFQLIITYFP